MFFWRSRGCGPRSAALACAAAVLTALLPIGARGDDESIKPFGIIDRALDRWRSRPRPQQLTFVVEFTGRSEDRAFRRRMLVEDRVDEHLTHVTVLTSDGAAPPFVQPEKLRMLPTETFGFVPAEAGPPAPAPAPSTDMPVIAAVHAGVRYPYDVRLVDLERIDDRSAYHLRLDPRQARDAHPLRELWVDAATYDVVQVVAQRFEHIGPIEIPYLVTVRYAAVGPYWLISHVEAGATVHAGLFSYGSSGVADFEDFHCAP